MIDPDSLDSCEVLAHLKQLGYQNINGSQLKEFMHDLKKLIKYEQKYGRGFVKSGSFDGGDSRGSSISSSTPESELNFEQSIDSSGTDSSDLCSNCNITKSDTPCDMSQDSNVTADTMDVDSAKKKLTSISQQTNRPQPSFIRPWRLQPTVKGHNSNHSLKTDPVQLYHKYKELWALQKVPGEKSHSQLRWTIREKMLGQDPQPRPISQASSDGRSRSMSCK